MSKNMAKKNDDLISSQARWSSSGGHSHMNDTAPETGDLPPWGFDVVAVILGIIVIFGVLNDSMVIFLIFKHQQVTIVTIIYN